MKTAQDFEAWLAKQPQWAQMEIRTLRNQIKTLADEAAVLRGDIASDITYGYGTTSEKRNIPDNLGPIHFKIDENNTVSIRIEKAYSAARSKCLHVSGSPGGVAIMPLASNCVRIYPFEE